MTTKAELEQRKAELEARLDEAESLNQELKAQSLAKADWKPGFWVVEVSVPGFTGKRGLWQFEDSVASLPETYSDLDEAIRQAHDFGWEPTYVPPAGYGGNYEN